MKVKSQKENGVDFYLDEYSNGFRVSCCDYSSEKTLFLSEVMEAVKIFLTKRGRPIPETDNLLVVDYRRYEMNFKTGEIIPGEVIDSRPLRRSNFGLYPRDR